jgi:SAM-dependent methyltransferase
MNWTKLFTGGSLMHDKRSRNRYPPAVIDLLVEKFGFHTGLLGADVGSGTGRLAALFLDHGFNIIAIESDGAKRAECERLRERWQHIRVHNGTPENTGLETASVDFVTAPRALYWPDQEAIRVEVARILKPGGLAMLITDNRVYGGALQSEAYEDLLRSYCVGFREKVLPHDIAGGVEAFFAGGDVYEDAFMGHQSLTFEALADQTRSLSICPRSEDPQYQPMMRSLRAYFEKWSVDGALVVPTVCRVAVGHMGN